MLTLRATAIHPKTLPPPRSKENLRNCQLLALSVAEVSTVYFIFSSFRITES